MNEPKSVKGRNGHGRRYTNNLYYRMIWLKFG